MKLVSRLRQAAKIGMMDFFDQEISSDQEESWARQGAPLGMAPVDRISTLFLNLLV